MHTLEDIKTGMLKHATHLDISENLTTFPSQIFGLADTLEALDLSGNQIAVIPADIAELQQLKVLDLSCNQLTELPEALGELKQLQKLVVRSNQLKRLPESLSQCRMLQSISIADNQFSELPAELDNLPKLAWLTFSENPCSAPVDFSEIDCPKQCVIDQDTELALQADSHEFLGKPSPKSARDTFADDFMLTVDAAHKIVLSIAAILSNLSQQSLSHGAVHAHTILSNPEADIILSGFAALSQYQGYPAAQANSIQAIEVRAFGCLLEDLLGSSYDSEENEELFEPMVLLKNRCMHPKPAARPKLTEIYTELNSL